MLRKLRITSQIIFFLLFSAVFFYVNRPAHGTLQHADLFLRFNPLVGLLTSIASREIILSLLFTGGAVAVLTVVFGRFFCGGVCPLGAAIDFSDRFIFAKSRSGLRRPPRYLQRLKYVLLTGLIILALMGALFPLFMDPISIMTRFFTFMLDPVLRLLGGKALAAGGPLLDHFGFDSIRLITIVPPLFSGGLLTASLFLLVFAGSFWDRRFYCQYICPSGALFALLSRFPLFTRRLDPHSCNSCANCSRLCPTRAINPAKIAVTSSAECIECGICTQIKERCSTFKLSLPSPSVIAGPDLHRRNLLLGFAGGMLLAPVFKTTAAAKADSNGRLIRPPGSLPENDFLARCIACGNCMKSCPTNAIQPCTFTAGIHRLGTARIVPRIGGCDSKCTRCGQTCPTGAIRALKLDVKEYAKIGTAVIDKHRCLAWAQCKECVVCDEVCPYNAIDPIIAQTDRGLFKVPVVNSDLCMGCGICEKNCPVFHEAAIQVYTFGENRRANGTYVTASQKEKMIRERHKSDQGMYSENATTPAAKNVIPENELPPGFVE
ncbi:MAG: 4Fe-4S binding protein [Chitinispirillaceae bacterium]|jgi:MauM/NapG family ferredoxin protein|nr:4Fe-4S binding protein [Chitinispirillaceae bacterium]